jgi:hypothetical protein
MACTSNRPINADENKTFYCRPTLGVITVKASLSSVGPYTIWGDGTIWDEGLSKAIAPEQTSYDHYFDAPLAQYPSFPTVEVAA